MCDDNIEIGVTEITNNILVSAQPTDQIIDINVLEEIENVELTITPSVVEVNIDVTQELITEVVTVDANTCVNIVDVTVTDATDNVTLNITPSLVEVNINRGENNLNIEEYDTFADLPTIGETDTYYITLDENKFWRWDSVDEVYVEISSADDRIPYLGAIKNSDLGEWGIKTNWLGLDTTPTNPPTAVGTLTWNDVDGTADLILKGGNVTLQIGQENVVRVVNKTGATLNEADFRAVRVRSVSEGGAQGQRLAVLLAMADSDADSATTIGIVTESISNNQEGFITTSGEVKKINTTGAKSYGGAETWVDGDILYLSPTHAGYLTNVKPQAPNHTIIIGWVVYAHANNGKIFVKVDNGYELDELHNVKITTPTNGQGLIYDSTLGVWKNQAITTSLTATSPLSIASNVLSISKADATTDGYLSASDWVLFNSKQGALSLTTTGSSGSSTLIGSTLNIPTYTLAGLGGITATFLSGGTGISYNSSTGVISYSGTVYTNSSIRALFSGTAPITYNSSTGVIGITQANATTDGYVSASDWNYFSAKQQPLSGTGFVKATGSVISYDNTVYTPQSRTLTINGTSYDLSADRSWSISVGSGMRNVSSFVATSGQTTFTIVGGYTAGLVDVFVNGTRLNSSDYTATNGTTVVLGTGVVANDIVDIINYTASLTSGITGSGTAGYLPLWSGSSNLTNSIVRQDANGVYVDFATGTKVFKVTKGVIASQDGGLYAGSGYQLVFADYGSAEYAAIEGSSFSGASSYIRFLTNSNEQMRLTSSGNLGLGYSSPRAKLDVNGYVYSGGFWTTNDSLGGAFYIGDLATGASYTYISGKGTSSTDTYLSLSTNNTERVRIIANGNVGIGLINPAYKLDVSGDVNITGSFRINGVAITSGGGGIITGSGTANYITKWSGTSAITNSLIYDNGTNVSIGTTTSFAKVTIEGGSGTSTASTLMLNQGAGGTSFAQINGCGDASHGLVLRGYPSNGTTNNFSVTPADVMSFYDYGGEFRFYKKDGSLTEQMRIASNGSVGINGAPNPDSGDTRLQINGTTYTTLNLKSTNVNSSIRSHNINGGLYLGTISNHFVALFSNDTERMRITSAGNVGIGTTSPSYKLAVLSAPSAGGFDGVSVTTGTNDVISLFRTGSSYSYGMVGSNQSWMYSNFGDLNIMTDASSASIKFGTSSGVERMRIISDGSVAIGSTTRANVWGLLTLRNTLNSSTQRWGIGPDTNNSLTVYNPSNVGVYITDGGTSWTANSDINLKNIENYIENALESINDLSAIRFNWKNDSNKKSNIGLIAQEVQKVYPELIDKNSEGYLGVRYTELIPILVQAIKELNAKLEAK